MVTVVDQASIELYGLRPMSPIQCYWICDASVAALVAQNILQRSLYIRNTYQFRLGWKYCLLEPMDLVTLTEGDANGLQNVPVRITSIEESETGDLTVTCEDAPPGVSHGIKYPTQSNSGYTVNQGDLASSINDPILFAAPAITTISPPAIWAAVSGTGNYGGCEVWISSDGSNYKQIGVIAHPAKHGVLTATMATGSDPDTAQSCLVDLSVCSGTLLPGSSTDADNRSTLCWVDGEFISYSNATLTSSFHYTLDTYIRRGLYNTPIVAHTSGTHFVLCNDSIFKYQYDPSLVGKTLYVKFPAFNIYGKGGQSLSDATEYSFVVTGMDNGAEEGLTLVSPGPGVPPVYGRISILPQNIKSANYTLVSSDAGTEIYHPSTDNNARTYTVPSHASVPFPIGTVIGFANMSNVLTIAITSDTIYMAGSGGTGSRTIDAYGMAFIKKISTTEWVFYGIGIF